MWRPITHTSVTRHQQSMKMMKKLMRKKFVRQIISIEDIKTRKHFFQACHRKGIAIFKSNSNASLIFSMYINVLFKLILTIVFYFTSFILLFYILIGLTKLHCNLQR